MNTINVTTEKESYEILVGEKAVATEIAKIRQLIVPDENIAIISDKNVWDIYGEDFLNTIVTACTDKKPCVHIINPGEENKTIDTLSQIFDALAGFGISRKGLILSLGGGVVGDISGFASACWMRGIKCVQIPTTLLAMVDSSVGGKTAVDIPAGKNLVGAFHQPSLVIVDPDFLQTLPKREFASGMAEVIKTAAIKSSSLFTSLENSSLNDDITPAIAECIEIKKNIVEEDEFEQNIRKILNFGHTFGHAIEVKYGFSKYTHGEAVAAGMLIATKLGVLLGITPPDAERRLEALLQKYDLDIKESADDLLEYIKKDKKASGAGIDIVLLKDIGEALVKKMTFEELQGVIKRMGYNVG